MENSPVMLVIQTRIKPDKNNEFIKWGEKLNKEIVKFPGYLSQTISQPNPPIQLDWIIIQNFVSTDAAKKWLQSTERQELLKEVQPLLVGIDNVYLVEGKNQNQKTATASITNIIDPKDEKRFLEWQARIAPIQSKFPGFVGYKLEKPNPGIHDNWITLVTFDSDEHLENWLKSPERKKMLKELNSFTQSQIQKVYTGFDFWFSKSNRSPWKENMLVLLTLYPIVFLLSYVQNPVMKLGVPFWLALFFSNATSTLILGYLTTPWLMKIFSWWLNPKKELEKKYNLLGTIIVIFLYALSLLICWLLSKYS